MGFSYSSLGKIKIGILQGSVLGPMLFNIFVNDLFQMDLESEICNYADDNTIYARSNTLEEVINNLENDLSSILQWFTENGMASNPEKFQLMFLGLKSDQQMCLSIGDKITNQCQQVKLLGVTIDSKLNFDDHIFELCHRVNRKVSAFSRLMNYLDNTQA